MSGQRKFAIYAITRHGVALGRKLLNSLPNADLFVSPKQKQLAPEALDLQLPMGPTLEDTWRRYDCHIHIISVGAVVRMIAPLMVNKKVDPAVICVDDDGSFAVCLLSGHVGRGNEFTGTVASAIGAKPVITTASDVRGTLTVDILGRDRGWTLDDPDRNVTRGCAAVVNEERVLIIQETGEPEFWPLNRPLPSGVEYAETLRGVDPQKFSMLLIVSDRDIQSLHPQHFERSVIYRPKSLVLGVGCDRGTPKRTLSLGIDEALREASLSPASVHSVATLDIKGDEPGLVALCEERGWPLILYPAEQLDAVPGVQNPSNVVRKHVGTRSVGEAACLLAASSMELLVPKTKFSVPGQPHNMTTAVARIPFPSRRELAHVEGAKS